ncbi:MAG: LOG family protein [Mariprofundaceae bacterium]
MRQQITAFGSSRLSESDPRYMDVRRLGEVLAKHGWDAITGGHQGLMAAFAGGIHAGGGKVRGITLECFPTPPGNHLSEEVRARDFFHRMQTMIEETDAYIVLPGGLGTLAELAMSWDLLAIHILETRPLILYGKEWLNIVDVLRENLILSVDRAFSMISPCDSVDEVCRQLGTA